MIHFYRCTIWSGVCVVLKRDHKFSMRGLERILMLRKVLLLMLVNVRPMHCSVCFCRLREIVSDMAVPDPMLHCAGRLTFTDIRSLSCFNCNLRLSILPEGFVRFSRKTVMSLWYVVTCIGIYTYSYRRFGRYSVFFFSTVLGKETTCFSETLLQISQNIRRRVPDGDFLYRQGLRGSNPKECQYC